MDTTGIKAGIAFGGLSVILGAFAAHTLKEKAGVEVAQIFKTGAEYQMYHAFALIACGILFHLYPSKLIRIAVGFFIIGIVLFSGSLYALSLMKMQGTVGLSGIGILTPIGGVFFILGWVMLLMGVVKSKS